MTTNNLLKKEKNTREKPSEEQAKEAVRTLIAWAGDDPNREGLLETPKRVIKAYNEFVYKCFKNIN